MWNESATESPPEDFMAKINNMIFDAAVPALAAYSTHSDPYNPRQGFRLQTPFDWVLTTLN